MMFAKILAALIADGETPSYWEHLGKQVINTIVFLLIGLCFFALSDWMVERILPRSLRKGIEEDKNVALAIVIGAVILGVAWIVAAAIH
jgi:NhaP-type Na+/H+ or K+/H+ antiporter